MALADLERTLTELDHVRLTHLLERDAADMLAPEAYDQFDDLLGNARLVASPEVAPDVVTMNTVIELHDSRQEAPGRLTLAYPAEADPTAGRISVLSPLGRSLLGLRVGDVARWTTPDGREHAAKVAALPYQPEASGDYTR